MENIKQTNQKNNTRVAIKAESICHRGIGSLVNSDMACETLPNSGGGIFFRYAPPSAHETFIPRFS
jgi:hypothetical protein